MMLSLARTRGMLALAFACATFGACSTTNEAVGYGGECFVASDCAPGLICVAQENGARACTDDLTGVQGEPPVQDGRDGAAEADGAALGDGGTPDGGGNEDAGGTPDAGSPDAAKPDAGTPDAGQDAGNDAEP